MKQNLNEYLERIVEVKIDRPIGSKHEKYELIYPVNYGFIENTISGDDEEIDCYILGVFEPIKSFRGKCIAIVNRLNDYEDKLIIVPENRNFTSKEIEALIEFQERFFEHKIITKEPEFNCLIPELTVSNIDTSKKFYIKLGFEIVYERLENKFCFIKLENNELMIEERNDNWNVAKLEYPYGNGINISMSIKNVEKMYKKLKDENTKFFKDLEVHEYRVNEKIFEDKEFLIQDPDGYLLRFNN